MVIGIFVGSNRFMVHEVNIQSKALPQSFDGFKIVQISDIHTGSWYDLKSFEKSVKLIQNLNPDMIVFTGDLVNSITDEAYRFEDLMASFNASYGKFAVLGNHDYGAYASWPSEEAKAQNLADLESFYERTGWKLLKNQSVAIVRGSDSIGLIGVENWGDNLRFPQYGNIDSAIYGMSEMPFFVLLSHDPSHWTKVVCEGYPQIDLTLSGHTHAFQFGITVGSFEWSPVQYLYPTWAGLYEKNGQFLNVNRGLGCLSYPGRIGIYPEITLVTLHTK
jgi:Predicted phosphohydrolases